MCIRDSDKVKLYVKKTVGKAIQIKNLSDQLFEFFLINSGPVSYTHLCHW